MKITLALELHTEMRYGGNRGTIVMFTKTVVLTKLTGKQLTEGFEDHYIHIDHWNFRPKKLVVLDNVDCVCSGFASAQIFHKSDSLHYYQDLKKKGWVAVVENAKAIQCDGYPNFRPSEF